MANSEEYKTTNVVICGCGLAGAMLSAYLGQTSIKNVVVKNKPDITTDPRGIALDEDGIRLLQDMGLFKFIDGIALDLSRKPFFEMDYNTRVGDTAHVGFICHDQPVLERYLCNKMAANGHSDLRSGCTNDVQYPEDCIKALRSRPFKFSARSCNKWSGGRVVLCGDAHVFPPWDCFWTPLQASIQGLTLPHEKFLAAWYLERKQQFKKSLALTIRNAKVVTESNPIKTLFRNWTLWFMQLNPSWHHQLRQGPRAPRGSDSISTL
ncbi:hypothetical protein TSTA_062700 [Talaromyces stipitatus ATCC 10500]|uniref:FAD-binding domain-containing protein n=1 Tax=Talaromyces stipitatus (strain ATCC 10500 / CBS 375.48 / QM 6759 / NRRL 1006) TaxID=441959 RepID=B8LXW8_TALSN|nr:uncharacterized protein TSTA_062700 [Talaromyces stipitatus ATCC 10500]EED22783.1 hypothetical protein TSTA_062700 [Talaromyces stipitatus ATCC 10500]